MTATGHGAGRDGRRRRSSQRSIRVQRVAAALVEVDGRRRRSSATSSAAASRSPNARRRPARSTATGAVMPARSGRRWPGRGRRVSGRTLAAERASTASTGMCARERRRRRASRIDGSRPGRTGAAGAEAPHDRWPTRSCRRAAEPTPSAIAQAGFHSCASVRAATVPAHRLLERLAPGKGLSQLCLRTMPAGLGDHLAYVSAVARRHLRCRIGAQHRAGQPRPLADVPRTRPLAVGFLLSFSGRRSSLCGGLRIRRTAATADLFARALAQSSHGIWSRPRLAEIVSQTLDSRYVAPLHPQECIDGSTRADERCGETVDHALAINRLQGRRRREAERGLEDPVGNGTAESGASA